MATTFREGKPPLEHDGDTPPTEATDTDATATAPRQTAAVTAATKSMRQRATKAPKMGTPPKPPKRTIGRHKK